MSSIHRRPYPQCNFVRNPSANFPQSNGHVDWYPVVPPTVWSHTHWVAQNERRNMLHELFQLCATAIHAFHGSPTANAKLPSDLLSASVINACNQQGFTEENASVLALVLGADPECSVETMSMLAAMKTLKSRQREALRGGPGRAAAPAPSSRA